MEKTTELNFNIEKDTTNTVFLSLNKNQKQLFYFSMVQSETFLIIIQLP